MPVRRWRSRASRAPPEALVAIESGADLPARFPPGRAQRRSCADETLTASILAELLRMRGAPRLAVSETADSAERIAPARRSLRDTAGDHVSAVPPEDPWTPAIPVPKPALTDVKTLREQARRHIEEGAVTEYYGANRDKVIELLNEALATELVCVLRYRHDYFMARGHPLAWRRPTEFLEHSNDGAGSTPTRSPSASCSWAASRDFNPNALTGRSHAEYRIGKTLQEAIKENLVAERIAIDSYREMIQFVGDSDPDDAPHAGGDPRDRGRARRRPRRPAAAGQGAAAVGEKKPSPAGEGHEHLWNRSGCALALRRSRTGTRRRECGFGDAARLGRARPPGGRAAARAGRRAASTGRGSRGPSPRGPSPSWRAGGRGSVRVVHCILSWWSHPAAALAQGNFLHARGQYGTVHGQALGGALVGRRAGAEHVLHDAAAASSIRGRSP